MKEMSPEMARALVKAMYRGILKREPDTGGMENYARALESGVPYEVLLREFVSCEEFGSVYKPRAGIVTVPALPKLAKGWVGSNGTPSSSSRPVCIAGMHRSGTSLVANMLRICGVYLGEPGDFFGGAPDNPDGFWEHRGFAALNERALSEMGGAWDLPPPAREIPGELSAELKAYALTLAASMEGHGVWGWKDPRNCLTLRLWRALWSDMLVVIPVRNPLETAASLRKRNGFSELFGLNLWAEYYWRVLDAAPPGERIVTHYDSYFTRPEQELRRVLGFLGIPPMDEAINEACTLVKAPQRHHRLSVEDMIPGGMPESLPGLYAKLCGEAGVKEVLAASPAAPEAGNKPKRAAKPATWHFPSQERCWAEVLEVVRRFIDPSQPLFAPSPFMEFFPRTLPVFLLSEARLREAAMLVFHRDETDWIGFDLRDRLMERFDAVMANELFVGFARKGLAGEAMEFDPRDLERFHAKLEKLRRLHLIQIPAGPPAARCAAVISAYNRPWALARTLPQVMRLGCPVLVVEDGSDSQHAEAYRKIREETPGVHWLAVPENRGIACAINTGVSYWLADADVEWISCFEEDVDVHPELLKQLALVQDGVDRPLLTGRRPPEHPVVGEEEINGVRVLHFHSTPGQHFHAHRQYWSDVLPIPAASPAFRGFKKTAYCDWWLASWAPRSVCNTGRTIVCVPGLVSAFATKAEDSTWGNESGVDAGLMGTG